MPPVADSQSPDLRIGDTERDEALQALGEHLSVGRLDADEYGERAARITAAKTRGELTALFTALPQPHPRLDRPPGAAPLRSGDVGAVSERDGDQRPAAQRYSGALVSLTGILAVVLFFSVPGMTWLIFLLPAAIAVITGALWGQGQHRVRGQRRDRMR